MINRKHHYCSNEAATPFVSAASLKALTAAALCLPGLLQGPAYAGENEAVISYGHYQEGARNLYGATSAFKPIEVDSLMDSGHFEINDRLQFYRDSWRKNGGVDVWLASRNITCFQHASTKQFCV